MSPCDRFSHCNVSGSGIGHSQIALLKGNVSTLLAPLLLPPSWDAEVMAGTGAAVLYFEMEGMCRRFREKRYNGPGSLMIVELLHQLCTVTLDLYKREKRISVL